MSAGKYALQKSLKRKDPETSDNPMSVPSFQMNKEFLSAEEELKADHKADYQIFLEVPEVHPEYGTYYQMFMDQFSKRYGDDPARCKELWEAFWPEIIEEKQEKEWRIKRAVLIKQFQIQFRGNKNSLKKMKSDKNTDSPDVKTSGVTDLTISDLAASDISHSCVKENGVEILSMDSASVKNSVSVSSNQNDKHMELYSGSTSLVTKSEWADKNSSISQSLQLLEDTSDALGDIFGSILRRVIKKIKEFKDPQELSKFLKNKDTKKLLSWVSGKLKRLSAMAVGNEKERLVQSGNIARNLSEYGVEGTQSTRYGGLDLRQVAAATYDKAISTTIGIIRETLRFSGDPNPSDEVVNKVFGEVSSLHLEMALEKQ
ncbi:uncharacterized protein LOC135218215 [Macrobrachium nipponense]|uniref:uncharacterized protein LOC135218215 n=1 Tax=Macrobrachium nipponense TaxID=159736 RepID=UPI0030C7F4ED